METAKGRRGGVLHQYFDANRNLASLGVAASDATAVTGSGTITIERRSDGRLSPFAAPTAAITSSATTRSAGCANSASA